MSAIQYASGYQLDLYCDQNRASHQHYHMETFTGETFAECAKVAKKLGWKIHRKTRTATCPTCMGTSSVSSPARSIP